MRKFSTIAAAAIVAVGAFAAAPQTADAASAAYPPQRDYSFRGFFGSFDRAELQRGLQVYLEACASCHSLDLIAFRDLSALGYSDDEIKAFAASFEFDKVNRDSGEIETKSGIPADYFPNPYQNAFEAAATHGVAPPDFSLIVKARAHGVGNMGGNFVDMLQGGEFSSGASYIAALIGDGYVEEPTLEDKMNCMAPTAEESHEEYVERLTAWEVPEDGNFNRWFPGCLIAMSQPLYGEDVEYTDGTEATMEQMAHDISVFLAWASEPTMEERKQTGIKVLLFLAVFTGVLIAVKRETWKDVKKH